MVYLQLLGATGLILRYWLDEKKLVDELQFRRHYASRILTYYAFIAMMLNLKCGIMNMAVMLDFPVIVISIIGWDSLFFVKFKRRTYWEKNHGWLIVERLTMHPPLLALQLYMVFTGPMNYINPDNLVWEFICAVLLGYLPWLLWDKRWKEKDFLPKERRGITVGTLLSTAGWIIYFILVIKGILPTEW